MINDRFVPQQPKDAHPLTVERNAALEKSLDFADTGDFDDARRGFIATLADATVRDTNGTVVWSLEPYDFLEKEKPPLTANPSLWRLSRLNSEHGLFKVTDRIYQVRGFDLANITFIEGDTGLIVIDPLTFEEPARAALELYRSHRGQRPVLAVFYSHSHRDHYGGVKGVVSEEDVAAGRVQIIAPEHFMKEALSEAILVGVPMRRRAQFQFGNGLPPGERSQLDAGLGKGVGRGTSGIIPPTKSIRATGERMVIDGVEIIFQMTPGTEAPAEMNFYFPRMRALNMAENACHTMHNLCPIRGAKVRDALAWTRYLDETVDLFAGQADVCLAQHHWPTWGAARVAGFLTDQRDLYRYLHDQTLRMMSHGLTHREISDQLMMPTELSKRWHTRGYYGAVAHNVQAIYTFYLGPYDGNPANLNSLPPEQLGTKLLEYMGGVESVMQRAREDFERGEFRWVATVMNHAVFADSKNRPARELCADAFEQLGYQAESATWRNAYLLGARELRAEALALPPNANALSVDAIAQMPIEDLFDFLAIRIVPERCEGITARIDWIMTDTATTHRLTLDNNTLSHRPGSHGDAALATLRTTRTAIRDAVQTGMGIAALPDTADTEIQGDIALVRKLFSGLDQFNAVFPVVEP